jgi:hypothetical protein
MTTKSMNISLSSGPQSLQYAHNLSPRNKHTGSTLMHMYIRIHKPIILTLRASIVPYEM